MAGTLLPDSDSDATIRRQGSPKTMIATARFTNFKLLRDVEISLDRLNVVVGVNGVGKSSLLDGLHYVLQLAAPCREGSAEKSEDRLSGFFVGSRSPEFLCSKPESTHAEIGVVSEEGVSFGIACRRRGSSQRFEFDAWSAPDAKLDLTASTRPARNRAYYDNLFKRLRPTSLSSVVRLRLDSFLLGKPSYSDDSNPRVGWDGEGLASVLQRIQIAREGLLEEIERQVAAIVPEARRIRTTQVPITRAETIPISIEGKTYAQSHERTYTGAGIEVDWGKVGWVPARHLSEGTLLVIGLLTVLLHKPPSLVLIDDLDKALHPTAQREVVQLLKRVVEQNPAVQILATTHSPFVVAELEPANVLVASCTDERSTQIRRLSAHPSWEKQREYLDPGEFWSAVGEGWVRDPASSS